MKFPENENSEQVFRVHSHPDSGFALTLMPTAQETSRRSQRTASERSSDSHEYDSVTNDSDDSLQSVNDPGR